MLGTSDSRFKQNITRNGNGFLNCRFFRRDCLRIFILISFVCLGLVFKFMVLSDFEIMTPSYLLEIYEKETNHSQITRNVWELYPQNSTEATLARKVKVLCWILTMPENHDNKALAVKRTWGERCNTLLFISSTFDTTLPTVPLISREGRGYLWTKTAAAFNYIYRKGYLDDVDWVLKADDDTFVVMENLRLLLSDLDPNKSLYLGLLLKWPDSDYYMAGGPGYVLSKRAARRLVEEALPSDAYCNERQADYEDIEMGECMAEIDAEFVDTRDEQGRERFHPDKPDMYLRPGPFPQWYDWGIVHKLSKGMNQCCADKTISFHYVDWTVMYALHFATYRLNPISSPTHSNNTRRKSRRKTSFNYKLTTTGK